MPKSTFMYRWAVTADWPSEPGRYVGDVEATTKAAALKKARAQYGGTKIGMERGTKMKKWVRVDRINSNPSSRRVSRKSLTIRNAASVKITQSRDGRVQVLVRRKNRRKR